MDVDVVAERHARPFANVVAIDRFPLMPLHAGIHRQDLLDVRAERRRGDRLREHSQSRAVRLRGAQHGLQCRDEFAPRRCVAELAHDLRAIGIVEAEDGCLHEGVACTER